MMCQICRLRKAARVRNWQGKRVHCCHSCLLANDGT